MPYTSAIGRVQPTAGTSPLSDFSVQALKNRLFLQVISKNKDVQVRKATIGDLDVIVDFIGEEAREAEGRTQSRKTLESGIGEALRDDSIANYWLLVEETGTAIGCASVIKEWSDWNAGYYWWIQSMYIAPYHRGKGYLSVLIDTIASAARAQKCLELRLYVHKENNAAARAYEKAGFVGSPYTIMSKSV